MTARQRIIPVRRDYNRWVANQTLEDYALRFTAKSARRFSASRISQTAIGAISFLALEAIGGTITLSYGPPTPSSPSSRPAMIMLVVGWPISRYAIRHGVDIDLLTRGASFGYIGSTITSLIYASFTFMLFAIEASIMTAALELAFGLPLWIGYIISAVVVIPLVVYGVRLISRFSSSPSPSGSFSTFCPSCSSPRSTGKSSTSGAPLPASTIPMRRWAGRRRSTWSSSGAASAVILALMPQIGEQVDFLRFLPASGMARLRHRLAVFLAGPGWVVVGVPKLLAGSFLAVLTLSPACRPRSRPIPPICT